MRGKRRNDLDTTPLLAYHSGILGGWVAGSDADFSHRQLRPNRSVSRLYYSYVFRASGVTLSKKERLCDTWRGKLEEPVTGYVDQGRRWRLDILLLYKIVRSRKRAAPCGRPLPS